MNIKQANQISLVDFLATMGHRPVKVRGYKYWYLSPFRHESDPSFKVNVEINLWYDFGDGSWGGIIPLAKRLFGTNDVSAILHRIQEQPGIPISCIAKKPPCEKRKEEPAMRNFTTQPLTHYALVAYLEKRRIPLDIGRTYCGEAHYELGEKRYFALAFANDTGGYELRNPYFKGCYGRKDITLIRHGTDDEKSKNKILLFEGIFSYMSYMTLAQKGIAPFCDSTYSDCIVLNSVNNIGKALEQLGDYKHIFMWLDNDTAGKKATETVEGLYGYKALDMSFLYDGFNDLNDYLCATKADGKGTKAQ